MKTIFSFQCITVVSLVVLIAAPQVGCVNRYYEVGSNTTTYGSSTTTYRNNTTTIGTPAGSPAIVSNQPSPVDVSSAQAIAQPVAEAEVQDDPVVSSVEQAAERAEVDPRDWWYWRGPECTGVSRETGLIDDFDLAGGDGSNVVWKRDDLGGRSTPVTLRGKLYTLVRDKPGTAEEGEKVVCVDMNSGQTLWENRFNVWLSDVPDTRVGWSSVVADPETGNVYALGVCGYFQCLNGETGQTIWDNPMHEYFGLLSTYGGRTNFPVICDDLVIVSGVVIGWGDMAKPAHRFVAFDKRTGEIVWYNGTRLFPDDTTYSSPTVTVIQGQKELVFGSGDGSVWGFQARTGLPIWKFDFSLRGINVSPLVIGNTVYIGQSEENIAGTTMGAVGAFDARGTGDITKSGGRWKVEELMMGKSSPVEVDGRLFCFDDRAKLHILDARTGEAVSRMVSIGGTMMRASPLFADGKIYAFSTVAWQILEPDAERGARVVSKGRLPTGEEVEASPICSHGKIFLQTSAALYCLEDKSKEHRIVQRPEPPQEDPVSTDGKPAHVQIIPAELLIQPGRIKTFSVRVFNSRGQLLDEDARATFELEGPGEIVDDGTFLASGEGHVATIVKGKVGNLEGRARVRVVPELPWKFDFENLSEPPITWVGARYRHVIREVDGSQVMVKVTTIPKGTRSQCWFGQPELHDYTIQADVKGAITDNKMPDIGLIAQGYTLDLQGANQKLELRTWVPHDFRTKKTVDFSWDAEKWYTMKLRASNDAGTAVLQGKVWPRDEEEPETWDVEIRDTVPNKTGSPGLYGNAKDAELFLDNITVTAN